MRFVSRLLLLVLVPVLGLVGLTIYLTVYFSNASEAAYERVVRTYENIETAQLLFSDLQDAESGVRGYVLGQNLLHLDTYNQAIQRFPGRLSRLVEITANDPQLGERVAQVRAASQQRLAFLQSAVENMALNNREGVSQAIGSGRGKILMDEVRRQVGEFVAIERQRLEQSEAESRQSDRFTLYVAIGGSLLALLALVVGTVLLLANNWRL